MRRSFLWISVGLLAALAPLRVDAGSLRPVAKIARTTVQRTTPRGPTTTFARQRLKKQSAALRELSSGLENALKSDAKGATEKLYALEVQSIDTLLAIANIPERNVDPGTRAEMMDEARALVRRVLYQKDHVVGPHAIKTVRAAIPGEPMAKLVEGSERDLYEPLDRNDSLLRDTVLVARPRAVLYNERYAQFEAAGGKPSDIVKLTRSFLSSVPSGQMVSWAHRSSDDKVWVSTTAKHIVTAAGEDAFGAGEIKVFKSSRGEIELVLLSNSSGGIKSGTGSLEGVAAQIVAAGVPMSRVLFTTQSPADPQLLKLLLISDQSMSKEDISARLKSARALAEAAR